LRSTCRKTRTVVSVEQQYHGLVRMTSPHGYGFVNCLDYSNSNWQNRQTTELAGFEMDNRILLPMQSTDHGLQAVDFVKDDIYVKTAGSNSAPVAFTGQGTDMLQMQDLRNSTARAHNHLQATNDHIASLAIGHNTMRKNGFSENSTKMVLSRRKPARSFRGVVKSHDLRNGHGVIRCEQAKRVYGSNMIIAGKSLSQFACGDFVRFAIRGDTHPVAVDIVPDTDRMFDSSASERLHEGTISHLDESKRYAFISCPEVREQYNFDAFLLGAQIDKFVVGTKVRFDIEETRNRRPKAVNVVIVADEPASNTSVDEQFIGIVKSYDPERGYGLITCQEDELHQHDVFVHKLQMNNFRVGDRVRFRLQDCAKGNLQAFDLQLLESLDLSDDDGHDRRPEGDGQRIFSGNIKSFSPMRGYGFIKCDLHICNRDVFFHQSHVHNIDLHAFIEGSRVTFTLDLRSGKPQARNVRPDLRPQHDMIAKPEEHKSVSSLLPPGLGAASLKICLLRACASCRVDSAADVVRILDLRADPNIRDVTGHRALMIAALNPRNSEQKCRLLIQHYADPTALYTSRVSVLEWARDSLSPEFSDFLLKLHSGKLVDPILTMELPLHDDY